MTDYVADMVTAYVECMLWAGLDWYAEDKEPRPLDENYGAEDVSPSALASIREDCEAFAESEWADLRTMTAEQAGHDFYLTRNRHGAGFWDRGLGAAGDRLSEAAHVYGESGEYVGDDGLIHV